MESVGSAVPLLSIEQLTELNENGFLVLPKITSDQEVSELKRILQDLFAEKAGLHQGAYFNFAGAEEEPDAPSIPQIMAPHNFANELKKTQFRKNATTLARQILGPGARFHIDHTLSKPPVDGAVTCWHQDEAFKDPHYHYREISFWMPLQPVDHINGCLEFIPGSHLGKVLPHRTPNDDPRVHALECFDGFDPAAAVTCPLPAGGCTIHFGRTLHASGPNLSKEPRFAYVLIFQLPPEPAPSPEVFPWLKDKDTARMKRKKRWLQSGGALINLWRVVKSKEIRDYKPSFLKLKKRLLTRFSR